jgi:phosphohistidine phosphatase
MSADRLYFAQHGLAVDKADDPERPLSPAGIEQTVAVASCLKHTDICISAIFHSGKLRALQTADIIAAALDVTPVSGIANLSPNDDVISITRDLNIDQALYVGHLPHLEKLVSYLVTDKTSPNIIRFQNSGIVCLEKDQAGYQIKWYLTPDMLSASPL